MGVAPLAAALFMAMSQFGCGVVIYAAVEMLRSGRAADVEPLTETQQARS
jgi:threonine/homoserine/homoserine lactone efflux protein